MTIELNLWTHINIISKISHNHLVSMHQTREHTQFFKSLATLLYVKKITLIPCNKPFGVHHLSYFKHFLIYLNANRVLIIHYENILKFYLVYSKIYLKYIHNIPFWNKNRMSWHFKLNFQSPQCTQMNKKRWLL